PNLEFFATESSQNFKIRRDPCITPAIPPFRVVPTVTFLSVLPILSAATPKTSVFAKLVPIND
ncbi:hypothetical protein, partial [Thermogutta sp.]|uniref:hypothetical protein n=1 Tax=Thermogutta sp. TaxID=1962930 RepID=UPI0025E921E0